MKHINLEITNKKEKEITSISSENNKYIIELICALSLYGFLQFLEFFTAWNVEWLPGKVSLLFFPFIMLIISQRPIESLGIKEKDIIKNAKEGLALGLVLAIILSIPLNIWTPAGILINIGNISGCLYLLFMITVYTLSAEIFHRGFIQPRIELIGGSIVGIIITAVISGLSFWETSILGYPVAIIEYISIGWLYVRNRSIISPIIGHLSFLSLMFLFVSI